MSALLDQGGNSGDDGIREGVPRHVSIGPRRGLPRMPRSGDQRSPLTPLIQSKHRRLISLSARAVCRRPPREGAARTSAGRVRRSVQERVSLCATMSERAMTRQRDQASRAPAGTEDLTRGPLVKTSQIVGAPSARGRESVGRSWEGVRK